jgi:hypothetical protein
VFPCWFAYVRSDYDGYARCPCFQAADKVDKDCVRHFSCFELDHGTINPILEGSLEIIHFYEADDSEPKKDRDWYIKHNQYFPAVPH